MCDDMKVDAYTRLCAVLTAYSESDFHADAVQYGKTFGVFQQDPAYWPTANLGTLAQCVAFLASFKADSKHHNGDPVHDAWITQRWDLPGSDWPDVGPNFESEKRRAPTPTTPGSETWNYARRLPLIPKIITERRLP